MQNQVWLITGSSRGLGRALAEALLAAGHKLVATARNPKQLSPLVERYGDQVLAVALDVTDERAAAAAIQAAVDSFGRLDVLVNNAAVSHAGKPGRSLEEIAKSGRLSVVTLDEVRAVFETNVFGAIAVTQAMLPLLRDAPAGRVVNVSSAGGSLTLNSDPKNPHRLMFGTYSSSKTALNAITLAFASALESTGIKVNAACPGFTATDLNNFQGTRTVQEAAREPVRLALLDANGPTGTFSNEDGEIPW